MARWLGPARAVAVELRSTPPQNTRTITWTVPAADDVPFTRTEKGVTRLRRGGPCAARLSYPSYGRTPRA